MQIQQLLYLYFFVGRVYHLRFIIWLQYLSNSHISNPVLLFLDLFFNPQSTQIQGHIISLQRVVFTATIQFTYTMKDRYAYSPRNNNLGSKLSSQASNSTPSTALFESVQRQQDVGFRSPTQHVPSFKELENLKKISEESSALRQTMNYKIVDRFVKNAQPQKQQQKPLKLNELLRQTIGARANKVYTQHLISDNSLNSQEVYYKPGHKVQAKRGYHHYTTSQITRPFNQSRSGTNLLQHSSNFNEYQKLHQKMERNKKIIEELRKNKTYSNKEETNYLKNILQKSPSFIDLDQEKQTEGLKFRKKNKEQSNQNHTPQLSKVQYISPFRSSPLIKVSGSEKDSPTINKGKITAEFTLKNRSQLEDFQQGRKLGQGKFGSVNIVRHKRTGGVFALKKIPKAMIKSHMMVQQLALQIRLQICLNHRNILGMHGFFDDKTHLYIVLQYMDGGTLYQRLKRGTLSEEETAVIMKQITESIEYLHDLGIAHRDIKPENIVISNNVYKLCDFGWAARCNERRKTYCGTFDYVAPEILEGVQYDMAVDLWCLGVMTFQLMTGKVPFYHISRKQTMKKILNVETENIIYPQSMSQKAKDFIEKLIRKNPTQRIKANQALLHPFLADADLDI